jgi:polyribonucleotide nucleotidyltransferase
MAETTYTTTANVGLKKVITESSNYAKVTNEDYWKMQNENLDSIDTAIGKKQNRITFTAGSGISIETSDDGTVKIACSYSDGDAETY